MLTSNCESKARLDGKVALITGATSGVGLEVAKDLATRGAKVIIASRNPTKLENAKKIITKAAGNNNVVTRQMDFQSLASIRNFAQDTIASEPRLDILVNNIGALGLEDKYTEDGLQLVMQVNYFGTFLLTFLLFPLLKASALSRIVNVASFMAFVGTVDVDQLNDLGRHSQFGYYSNAKLADILFTMEMNKRIKGSGVSVFSVDPGLVSSDFFRNLEDGFIKIFLDVVFSTFGKQPKEAAKTPIFLAVDPSVTSLSGRNFLNCMDEFSNWFGRDPALAKNLWETSKRLVRISFKEDWESNERTNFYDHFRIVTNKYSRSLVD